MNPIALTILVVLAAFLGLAVGHYTKKSLRNLGNKGAEIREEKKAYNASQLKRSSTKKSATKKKKRKK
ncbi:MAG: hypothetical protein Q4E53_10595 [Eubacteriales bacterium]|nr:hypothetical protein [Eubacteriales bacterium]